MSSEEYEHPSYFNCDDVSERCPVSETIYGDYFTQGACIFFVVAYGLALIVQGYHGWRLKAWGFVGSLAGASMLEFIGYVGRTVLSQNPWNFGAFVIQNLFLVLGPTVVAAAISVTFKHLVLYYGPQWSLIKPRLYPWIFVGTDVVSLLIQMAGGGLAAGSVGSTDTTMMDMGNNLMLAGVCFQVVNMVFCGGLMIMYMLRRRKALKNGGGSAVTQTPGAADVSSESDGSLQPAPGAYKGTRPEDKKVRIFIYAISVAYVAIIIRCIYR